VGAIHSDQSTNVSFKWTFKDFLKYECHVFVMHINLLSPGISKLRSVRKKNGLVTSNNQLRQTCCIPQRIQVSHNIMQTVLLAEEFWCGIGYFYY